MQVVQRHTCRQTLKLINKKLKQKPEGMAVKDFDRQFSSGGTSLRDAVTLHSVTLVMAKDNIACLHLVDFNCRGTRAHACRMLCCPLAHHNCHVC